MFYISITHTAALPGSDQIDETDYISAQNHSMHKHKPGMILFTNFKS